MLVFAREHRFTPSRRLVPPGRVIIQMRNIGEDDHDLAVRRADGTLVGAMPEVAPGGVGELRLTLAPGRYVLVCLVTGHEAAGMAASFVVRRPARPPRRP